MKINILHILKAHWDTMRNASSERMSYADVFIFYAIPATSGALSYYFEIPINGDVYSISISFFGIFVALLLNIQVAIFGIYQRKWDTPQDKRQAEIQMEQVSARRLLLSELNTNISYLTVISSISLFVFVAFFIYRPGGMVAPAVTVVIYTHFILTFIMIAKRSHSLFQKEYEDQ